MSLVACSAARSAVGNGGTTVASSARDSLPRNCLDEDAGRSEYRTREPRDDAMRLPEAFEAIGSRERGELVRRAPVGRSRYEERPREVRLRLFPSSCDGDRPAKSIAFSPACGGGGTTSGCGLGDREKREAIGSSALEELVGGLDGYGERVCDEEGRGDKAGRIEGCEERWGCRSGYT